MKKRILLVDESLTVQKVVALTLDRQRYQIHYAKTRPECIKQITENTPDLILVSDQVSDLNVPSFPKEMESWLGRQQNLPPVVLITGQDIKEVRNYAAVLRKPFSPAGLQNIVTRLAHTADEQRGAQASPPMEDEFEDQRLQKIFNDTFNDEASLVKETFHEDEEVTQVGYAAKAPPAQEAWAEPAAAVAPPSMRQAASSDLWGAPPPPAPQGSQRPAAKPRPAANQNPGILSAEDSMAYKAVLESKVEDRLQSQDLDEIVNKLLDKLVPPIVERLVQERLDQLLKDQDQFIDLKQD